MKKAYLLAAAFAWTLANGTQAQNIVQSLQKDVPGQGKVTIHQDPGIEALIGVKYVSTGAKKVLKTSGYRVQAYAGNNTRVMIGFSFIGGTTATLYARLYPPATPAPRIRASTSVERLVLR